jgi:hypothetical protein
LEGESFLKNDLLLVRRVIRDLLEAHFDSVLIEDWAEELQGLARPREHVDVDMMLLDPLTDALHSFVADHQEVIEKRPLPKARVPGRWDFDRALHPRWNGEQYETVFWSHLRWTWASHTLQVVLEGLPVASKEVLHSFRECHPIVTAARPSR